MLILSAILFYFFSLGFPQSEESYPLVTTSLGTIKGHYKKSYNGRLYSAFEGIPYAKPPINDLRFREPVDVEPWKGTWKATATRTCIQFLILMGSIGEEDCLYVNVYVPKELPSSDDNYDVVVTIHGGAFMMGEPALAMPTFLMDRDIVYVSVNYRLGIMGFLSTEDDVVPGNMGMKDQVLALRWVQQHIRQFGGNPNSVTLAGLSAGAAATHLHYFSKLSEGLFHRGISHSGTALGPWVIQQDALERAQYMATLLDCTISSNAKMIECLRQKPANDVVEKIKYLNIVGFLTPLAPFAPVVEKNHEEAFIDDHPYNLLKTGKVYDVPWIATAVKDEGYLGLMALGSSINDIDETWNDVAPYLLNYYNSSCESGRNFITEKVKKFYFKDNSISNDLKTLINLYGDRFFTHHLEKSVIMQSKVQKSSIYTYIYEYKVTVKNMFAEMFNINTQDVINHGDDGLLMYEMSMGDLKANLTFSKEDITMKDWFMDVYATFASGNDVSLLAKWTPADSSSNDFSYLRISNARDMQMETKTDTSSIEFWDSLSLMEKQIKPVDACKKNNNQKKTEL